MASGPKKKIGVMCSGSGSNFQAIIDACRTGEIHGDIVLMVHNRRQAYAATRAKDAGIKSLYINRLAYTDRGAFTWANLRAMQAHGVEVVVLAGYLEILGQEMVRAYPNAIINTHPALIPSFCGKGMYGEKVHQSVLEYGCKVSGATIHFVDEVADNGPIIFQSVVPVYENDDAHTLSARVLEKEHELLPRAVKLWCDDQIAVDGRKVIVKK